MSEAETEKGKNRRRFLIPLLFVLVGYLLGSVLPAGYVNYIIRAKFFPKTLEVPEPKFDRALLHNAEVITLSQLLKTKNENYPIFKQKYEGKPVRLVGIVQYFLEESSSDKTVVLTLEGPTEYDGAILTFDDANAQGMSGVKKGEPVASACMVAGASHDNVYLNHCELWTDK